MSINDTDRGLLEAFRHFDPRLRRPRWSTYFRWFQAILCLGVLIGVAIWAAPRAPLRGINALMGVVAASGVLVMTSLLRALILFLQRRRMRAKRHSKLEAEARAIRAIYQFDCKRAMKAIVRASGLQPGDLHPIDDQFISPMEPLIFSDDELDDFLGDLKHQTLRFYTAIGAQPVFYPRADDFLTPTAAFTGLPNKLRLVIIGFQTQQITVGEAIVDVKTGEIDHSVRVHPIKALSSVEVSTARKTRSLSMDELHEWMIERHVAPQVRTQIETHLERHSAERLDRIKRGQKIPETPFLAERAIRSLVLKLNGAPDEVQPISIEHSYTFSDLPRVEAALSVVGPHKSALEFRIAWGLLRDMVAGCLIALFCSGLTFALTTDLTENRSSSFIEEVFLDGPDGPREALEDYRRLPTELIAMAEVSNALQFACVVRVVNLREGQSTDTNILAQLPVGQASLLQRPDADGSSDWTAVVTQVDDEFVEGFVWSEFIETSLEGGRYICRNR